MRALLLTSLALLLGATASQAQQETIGQHYRAYNAALQGGDLLTAEREAAAALQLSQTQDGDGGHTAVLALNLATTRLSAGHGADALAPAQKALAIAQVNSSAGVDPLVARIEVGRAELASGAPNAAAHLQSALSDASNRPGLDAALYQGSADLGVWNYDHHQNPQARTAWQLALDHAGRGDEVSDLARAAADTGLAASIIMNGSQDGVDMRAERAAQDAIYDAFHVYWPLVQTSAPAQGLSVVQRSYAQTYAWSEILYGQANAAGRQMPPLTEQQRHFEASGDPANASGRPDCHMQLIHEPLPQYPNRENFRRALGAVVVYVETDDQGQIVRREIAAVVGANFADAVRAVLPQWRMEKDPSSPANCSMAGPHFRGVNFIQG